MKPASSYHRRKLVQPWLAALWRAGLTGLLLGLILPVQAADTLATTKSGKTVEVPAKRSSSFWGWLKKKENVSTNAAAFAAPVVANKPLERPKLNPARKRITDQAISGDLKALDSVQKRLADLNAKGVPIGDYFFAKAQAWLDFARDEYTSNDRSRVIEDALEQAMSIIEPLEKGQTNLTRDTVLLPTSKTIRADLWQKAETFKAHPNFSAAQDLVAQLEVQLVWAGHEERQQGWRQAKSCIQAAERLAAGAQASIEGKRPPAFGLSTPAATNNPSARVTETNTPANPATSQ